MKASWTTMMVLLASVIFKSVAKTLLTETRKTMISRTIVCQSLLTESTHRTEFFIPAGNKIVGFGGQQFTELPFQNQPEALCHHGMIVLSTAFRLGNNLIDKLML